MLFLRCLSFLLLKALSCPGLHSVQLRSKVSDAKHIVMQPIKKGQINTSNLRYVQSLYDIPTYLDIYKHLFFLIKQVLSQYVCQRRLPVLC